MKKHELAERISDLVVCALDDGKIERSRSFLPLDSGKAIGAGLSAVIPARPQLPFRGDRLAVWSAVAPSFLIDSIVVRSTCCGVTAGSIPADAFATRLDLLPMLDQQLDEHGFVQVRVSRMAAECFGQPLALPLAEVGVEITLIVTNAGAEPSRFVGVLLGDVERGWARGARPR